MTQIQPDNKGGKRIILGLVFLIIVAGLFAAKLYIESKIEAWAAEDLKLCEPMLKFESGTVKASVLTSSISYKNIEYSLPDIPGLRIKIGEIKYKGLDRDTLMGKAGALSTAEKSIVKNLQVIVSPEELGLSANEITKPIMEIDYYEISDIAYPYRDIRKALLKHKGNPDLQTFMSFLGDVISTNGLKYSSDIMRGFRLNLQQADLFDAEIGEITSSGLKDINPAESGFDTLIESLIYKNIKISAEIYPTAAVITTLDSIAMKGIKYNYKKLMNAFSTMDEHTAPEKLIGELIPVIYNYAFDSITAGKLTVTGSGVNFSIDNMSFGPRTIKEQGPNSINNIKLDNVFSIESIGMDKFVLSDMLVNMLTNTNKYINDDFLLYTVLNEPLAIFNGLRVDNLYIKNLDVPNLAKLNNWSGSLTVDDNLNIKSELEYLHFTPKAVENAKLFARRVSPDFPMVLEVLAKNPNGITLDSALSTNLDIKPKKIGYVFNFEVTAQDEGTLVFDMAGMTGEPTYYQTYGEPLLSNVFMSLEDKGIMQHIFEYAVEQDWAETPDEVRNIIIEAVNDALIEGVGTPEASHLYNFQQFLKEGGKLEVSFMPPQPDNLDNTEESFIKHLTIKHIK